MMHLVVDKDSFSKANNAKLTEVRLVSMKTEKQHELMLWLHSLFVLKLHSPYYSVPSAIVRLSSNSKKGTGKGDQ